MFELMLYCKFLDENSGSSIANARS